VSAYPPLAPLVLVLKVLLRSVGLNEVANGGLSGFSLTNLVLAHLMEELKASTHTESPQRSALCRCTASSCISAQWL
jgi:DNA polymerase sigma